MKAEITVGAHSKDHKVVLDGHDITKGLSDLTLHMGVGELPTITLRAPVFETGYVKGEVQVELLPETREILIRMGWTPPGVEDINNLSPQPGDVIVVRASGVVSDERAHRISKELEEIFPDHRVLVMDESLPKVEATSDDV